MRVITACLTCRHRKVKCDHAQPVCSPYDIRSRLERLEQLLERALSGGPAIPQHPADTTSNPEHPHSKHQGLGSSQNPQSETLSTDGYDGALLLDGASVSNREPSLFISTGMDVVRVEIRRRLWHQICRLDYRSAESRGQEPTISDEDFTTFLPRNISDENLVEGG
ncbi:hypothetical protein FOC1_g10008375 [Fusarium oxysporum f. sp. cubense race 1]|uniref:Zn(2)-C6 fungal-type domain-containing protein n=1 Tax=Fusarium oxysporum f. sp. cubense (strain race 1) TaxID=1229664 RepID=N4ULU6_FUSC1|nr:hypothetical protein FOC1_g10008375 [Fusarium oxysporum f. sp. cubense race 1]